MIVKSKTMENKYSPLAIREALSEWEDGSDKEPDLASLNSRIFEPGSKTVFFLNKKYHLYGYRFMPSHMFTVIDGKVFHPGSSNTEIFVKREDTPSVVVSLEERCRYCTYHYLNDLFKRDRGFNIFTNNCQIIMGQYVETALISLSYMLMILYVILGKVLMLIISMTILSYVIIHEKLSSDCMTHWHCRHIKSLRQRG